MCHLRHRYHRPSRPSQPRSPSYRTPTPGQLSLSLSAVAARPGCRSITQSLVKHPPRSRVPLLSLLLGIADIDHCELHIDFCKGERAGHVSDFLAFCTSNTLL